MEKTAETEVPGGVLTYTVKNREAQILSAQVKESVFEIPDRIGDIPVTVIARKAFLGSKLLREISFPENLKEAGDWAFANCTGLEKITLSKKPLVFGKGVFKECRQLREMGFREEKNKKLAGLFAMVPVMLDAEYLLSAEEAGEAAWLEKLDARLFTLLEKPDEEGYLKQVLCGEEDLMASLEIYLADRRREKAALCYARLLNDIALTKERKEYLQGYLKQNTKGCEYEAAWEAALSKPGLEKEYCRVFAEAGCITDDNFDGLLQDIGENNMELKAWFLRYKEEHRKSSSFFEQFILD